VLTEAGRLRPAHGILLLRSAGLVDRLGDNAEDNRLVVQA